MTVGKARVQVIYGGGENLADWLERLTANANDVTIK